MSGTPGNSHSADTASVDDEVRAIISATGRLTDAVRAELAAVARCRRQLDTALDALIAAVEGISVLASPTREPEDGSGSRASGKFGERIGRRRSGARLVAAQMALAGSTRGEVAAHPK